jgi:hypothetical protein
VSEPRSSAQAVFDTGKEGNNRSARRIAAGRAGQQARENDALDWLALRTDELRDLTDSRRAVSIRHRLALLFSLLRHLCARCRTISSVEYTDAATSTRKASPVALQKHGCVPHIWCHFSHATWGTPRLSHLWSTNYGLGHISGGRLRSWQHMYMVIGAVTILCSCSCSCLQIKHLSASAPQYPVDTSRSRCVVCTHHRSTQRNCAKFSDPQGRPRCSHKLTRESRVAEVLSYQYRFIRNIDLTPTRASVHTLFSPHSYPAHGNFPQLDFFALVAFWAWAFASTFIHDSSSLGGNRWNILIVY